jgi:hypothetical protein
LNSGRLVSLFGFFSAVALGCVITVGDGGKGSNNGSCPDENSRYDAEKDECFCDINYDWCNDDDISDLSCCVDNTSNTNSNSDPTGNPTSNSESNTDGTTTNEPTSGTTEEIPTTSGTTGDPLECVVEESPPGSCGEGEDFLCLQASNPACEIEGSKYYVCTNGVWVENPNGPDESCVADGFDFAYGCENGETMVEFVCGIGDGTPCEGGDTCNGETLLETCYYGKLGSTDCTAQCMEFGDMNMVTYDYGYCGEQRDETVCICCDEGDEGCPINEGTTTDGTSSTGDGESTGTTGA